MRIETVVGFCFCLLLAGCLGVANNSALKESAYRFEEAIYLSDDSPSLVDDRQLPSEWRGAFVLRATYKMVAEEEVRSLAPFLAAAYAAEGGYDHFKLLGVYAAGESGQQCRFGVLSSANCAYFAPFVLIAYEVEEGERPLSPGFLSAGEGLVRLKAAAGEVSVYYCRDVLKLGDNCHKV